MTRRTADRSTITKPIGGRMKINKKPISSTVP